MNTRLVVTLLAVTSLTSTATPSLAAQDVGVAAAVNREAQGTPPGRPTRTIILGNNIIFKERIETGGSGLVQVLLVDGSTFTVGANSDLVIDEFVYDPAAGTGKLVASFGKGVARFVGGKLSKGPDGVNVRTPVGTIGIRGGIANMDVRGDGAIFSLIYGKELTFAGRNGSRERVYEAGYTIAVGGNGQGSAVRRTTRADLGGIQNALGGRPGQNGGIPKPPTDNQVANSGIQAVNSGLGVVRAVPVPKPQVVRATELEQIEPRLLQVAQLDKLPDVKPDPKPTPTPDPTPEPTPEPGPGPRPDPTPTPDPDPSEPTKPEPTPEPTPTPTPNPTPNPTTQDVQARALFGSPGFYEVPGGSVIVSNPGAQGILGNNSTTTQDATLTLQSNGNAAMSGGATTDGAILRGTANGEQMSVPVPTSSGMHYFQSAITSAGKHFGALAIDRVPVLPTIDASTQGMITHIGRGAYYRGAHNFFALAYQSADTPETTPTFEGDLGDIRFLFGGTPTSFSSMVVTSGTPKLRTYTLEGDMQQAIRFGEDEIGGTRRILSSKALFMNPVASDALGSDFMAGVRSDGLTVLDGTGSGATTRPLGLASSFLISGQGSAQKSLVSLFAGEVFDDTVSLKMQGQRRGGYRSSSVDSSGNFSGRIRSVAGTDGAQAFGNNAQNFILSADLGNEPYHDSFAVVPTGITPPKQVSSSMHIANLQSSVDSTGLTRSDRGIAGYAAGVLQQPNGVGGLKTTALATQHPMEMSVEFDAARKSVSAEMQLTETGYQDDPGSSTDQAMSMDISFGDESAAVEDPRRSVFIDDDRYAALESNSSYSSTTIEDNDGNTAYGTKATSYFLPSTMVANGDAGLFAAGQKCTCAFLEWGYWGTSVATPGASAGDPDVLNQVHLGTWAAGRILGPGAMPTTGTASYSGHAVGSVVNGGAQYLAAGDFSMSVDFAARTGNAAISNFDGRNFTSALTGGSMSDDKNQMTGLITDGATMTGSFGASLVEGPNSPVEGVVGGFSAFDGAWSATGVVVGQQP